MASRVCRLLEADGIGCWLTSRNAKAGRHQAAAILEAIRDSDLVLLIFSAFTNASPYVLREIERAVAYGRPVLSLHIDEAVPNASLEYYLNLWQWLAIPGRVQDKRTEILNAVRGQLASASGPAQSRVPGSVAGSQVGEQFEPGVRRRTGNAHSPRCRALKIALALAVLVVAVGLGLGFGLPRHHNTWAKLNPSGTLPVGRDSQAVAYDSSEGLMMVFGGRNSTGFLDDTWAYEPTTNTWTELSPSGTAPSPRTCSMAYDPATHRLILFGGFNGDIFFNDTWAYDRKANTWTNLNPSGMLPPARMLHAMAYDPVTGRVIMFGGEDRAGDSPNNTGGLFNDTWAYDPAANTWTELKPSGALPPARSAHAMAYDSSRGLITVFGGVLDSAPDATDTWAYDSAANAWTELKPSGTLPQGRYGSSMAYDSSTDRVIMFGGFNGTLSEWFGDTWAYDSVTNTWTELRPAGEAPAARQYPSLVYVPPTGQVVMFGGSTPTASRNDTWAFTP
jgi:N-acetylneuraminic acid mutarotase